MSSSRKRIGSLGASHLTFHKGYNASLEVWRRTNSLVKMDHRGSADSARADVAPTAKLLRGQHWRLTPPRLNTLHPPSGSYTRPKCTSILPALLLTRPQLLVPSQSFASLKENYSCPVSLSTSWNPHLPSFLTRLLDFLIRRTCSTYV